MSSRATSVARDQTWGSSATSIGREQLVQSVLEPSARIHPDYGTIVATTTDGKVHTGVLRKRTDEELQLLDAEGRLVRLPLAEIEQEQRTGTSLMPAGLHKTLTPEQFADLIAYLETLKQPEGELRFAGMPSEIPAVEKPIRLVPLHKDEMRFDHPVWIIAIPGQQERVSRRRTEDAKDLALRGGPSSTKRNCSPTSATKRRPANSRAWCVSRSIRGSSKTASTT